MTLFSCYRTVARHPENGRQAASPRSPEHAKAALDRPAEPVAEGAAHDKVAIRTGQPCQFLGEEGHCLAVGAGDAGHVGAPEETVRTEGIEYLVQVRVQAGIGIR